ncbi:2-octaprenyl-6-methoxyphenyl hydroxylase [Thalassotalea profundi]|uniref:2-octaprenyl-6-methoxyphenyl hydroxylase n=1 Tax=Thalassotalea profundi TaxID=2036687 RepID=A0ABQ3IM18_9GAMM|nr:2-octaprenyl-6-methoxyphenyl hydroxylase [Thalassotalea profundi]GHE85866.1 2-octaprenyl-6-methoxyphenyl hydroxylase [Thalassotalea profundi]
MTLTQQNFDIVIAGGGLSGALAAIALSAIKPKQGEGLSIAVIEKNPLHEDPKQSFDDRVLALSHASANYLKELGVWSYLTDVSQAIADIHISDRGYYGKARIAAKDHQVEALGYVVEMAKIGKALLNTLKHNKQVTWFCPDIITSIDWQQESVNVELGSGAKISAKLLLGCDGAQSQCRQAANISINSKPYQQSALITNVAMVKPHNNVAYERFTEFGPIAMLPLTSQTGSEKSHRCSLVWTLPPEQAQEVKTLADKDFKITLEKAFGSWLGGVEKLGVRHVYPLNLVQAQSQVYHRMALIGNASHTIHPIAGQGFNLGLRDVQQLAQHIEDAIFQNTDYAQFAQLSMYAEKRKQDHNAVIELTDSLVTLFSNHLPPLVIGRNIGLKVLNYLTPLKNAFVNKTMGY